MTQLRSTLLYRRPRSYAGALVLALVLVASGAVGLSPSAAVACDKLFVAPKGDANNTAPGGDEENVENLDIISGGIAKETPPTSFTTQIQVANLSKDLPPNATSSINWFFHWTYNDVVYFSRARINNFVSDDPVYSFGTYAEPQYTTIDATTGSFNEGPNGTVQVDVPIEAVGAPPEGTTLTNIYATSTIGQGVPTGPGVSFAIDRGPKGEDTYGENFVTGKCEDTGGTPTASPGVKLRFNDTTPKRGDVIRARASLKVCPGHAGTKIQLQRKKSGSFRTIKTKKLNSKCKARFRVEASFRRATFRSFWKKQDADHKSGASKLVRIRSHR